MKLKTGIVGVLAASAGWVAWDRLRRRSWMDLRGKVVLITGASRGLGLQTAREFGSRGAIIGICARDEAELNRAANDLHLRGIQAHAFVCDITDREQVQSMIQQVNDQLGSIDILVNNAGIIKVGPISEMSIADFEQAMNVMFWGAVNTTLAVLPVMRQRRSGRIVNITSIGGKVSIPHLLPYCCAKFALVAFSEGLRTELAPAGIQVCTIVPGLMRTGSHLQAEFKGKQKEEYGWFTAGAATALVSIGAERAARSIVNATIRGTGEKILSVPADILARIHGISPGLIGDVLSVTNRLLPAAKPGSSHGERPGSAIEPEFTSALWKLATRPGKKAAEALNELPQDALSR